MTNLKTRARDALENINTVGNLGVWDSAINDYSDMAENTAETIREALTLLAREDVGVVESLAIAKEIIEIANDADEQEEERGYYDTPGGIEHKGDAIRLIRKWAKKLQQSTGNLLTQGGDDE